MAVVTIKITDDETTGGCMITAESDPPLTEGSDEQLTSSQYTGAMLMKIVDELIQDVTKLEGTSE
jgi:hypothetical protein